MKTNYLGPINFRSPNAFWEHRPSKIFGTNCRWSEESFGKCPKADISGQFPSFLPNNQSGQGQLSSVGAGQMRTFPSSSWTAHRIHTPKPATFAYVHPEQCLLFDVILEPIVRFIDLCSSGCGYGENILGIFKLIHSFLDHPLHSKSLQRFYSIQGLNLWTGGSVCLKI